MSNPRDVQTPVRTPVRSCQGAARRQTLGGAEQSAQNITIEDHDVEPNSFNPKDNIWHH